MSIHNLPNDEQVVGRTTYRTLSSIAITKPTMIDPMNDAGVSVNFSQLLVLMCFPFLSC